MKIKQPLREILMIIFISLALTSCMTPQQRDTQDYKVAKQNFSEQNYRTAFKNLQAPATAGNSNAQYALGYMYYYGKGTVQNPKMANYWFQRAAQNGQVNAQKALRDMQNG